MKIEDHGMCPEKLRSAVIRVRKSRHLGAPTAAKEIGISYNTILKFVKGALNPSFITLSKISKWVEDNGVEWQEL